MDHATIYVDRWARAIVRTDPPELKELLDRFRVPGTDFWAMPSLVNLFTGQNICIHLEWVNGEYCEQQSIDNSSRIGSFARFIANAFGKKDAHRGWIKGSIRG